MDQQPVEIIAVIDRSGSMDSSHAEVISGLNQFVAEQREQPGMANFTLVQFDSAYDVVLYRAPLSQVPTFTLEDFKPRGMTALYDAIGKTISRADDDFSHMQVYPRAIMCIITDGGENASKEYALARGGREAVKKLVQRMENEKGWEVHFLSSDLDAVHDTVTHLGVSGARAKSVGTIGQALCATSANVSTYRSHA